MSDSCVYFAQSGSGGLIKIGHTGDWRRREREIRANNGSELTILAVVRPGGRAVEKRLHARFAALRDHGEWFRPGGELLTFIEDVRAGLRVQGKLAGHHKPAPSRAPYRVVPTESASGDNPLDGILRQLTEGDDQLVVRWAKGLLERGEFAKSEPPRRLSGGWTA